MEPLPGFYFDMEICEMLPINLCPEGYFWSDFKQECECAFQPPYTDYDGTIYTWNTITCAYMCAPQTCLDDTYYWDADHCKCACHIQECEPNHHWDPNMCMCVCSGMPWQVIDQPDGSFLYVQECPCGTVWDEGCCECKTCTDQGQCGEGFFFNPATCSCACLPECCDEPLVWSLETCTCVDPDIVAPPTVGSCVEREAVCSGLE